MGDPKGIGVDYRVADAEELVVSSVGDNAVDPSTPRRSYKVPLVDDPRVRYPIIVPDAVFGTRRSLSESTES
jgi:hypothetical protein